MNTVIDLSEMHTRVVSDPSEIQRLRWFQTNRYFESGLLHELPTSLPRDPYLDDCTYFGVYGAGDQILATARIVVTDKKPEILHHHPIYPAPARRIAAESHHVAEVSRLAVGRDTPHYRALALLSREFLRHGLRHQDGLLLLASVGKPLVRILNRLLGVPVEVIGPQIDQYGDYVEETLPILIDTVECLHIFRNRATRRWEFFMEDLVIDVTSPAPLHQATRLSKAAS